ncbi:MAG: DNA-3-methyladenine glycosylase 2 family protein, partial [Betaproteobacteria bacterium]
MTTTPHYWDTAITHLSERDPTLGELIVRARGTQLTLRSDAFVALARAIVGQQISVKAAQSVWERLIGSMEIFAPEHLAVIDPVTLASAGLSRQKASYLLDLAGRFHSGALDPLSWPAMADEDIIEDLVRVKGIGRWTAEMFLMFHLQRPDVLPVADVGLQRAMSLHYNRGKPLTEKRLRKLAKPWAPYR